MFLWITFLKFSIMIIQEKSDCNSKSEYGRIKSEYGRFEPEYGKKPGNDYEEMEVKIAKLESLFARLCVVFGRKFRYDFFL